LASIIAKGQTGQGKLKDPKKKQQKIFRMKNCQDEAWVVVISHKRFSMSGDDPIQNFT
jgi:hypothetical protein